jgi:hypothetical protein
MSISAAFMFHPQEARDQDGVQEGGREGGNEADWKKGAIGIYWGYSIGCKQMFSDYGDFSSPYIAISGYFGKMGRFVGFENFRHDLMTGSHHR